MTVTRTGRKSLKVQLGLKGSCPATHLIPCTTVHPDMVPAIVYYPATPTIFLCTVIAIWLVSCIRREAKDPHSSFASHWKLPTGFPTPISTPVLQLHLQPTQAAAHGFDDSLSVTVVLNQAVCTPPNRAGCVAQKCQKGEQEVRITAMWGMVPN